MTPPDDSPRRFGIRPFLAIYLACAIAFQMAGATPSWGPHSSLEAFAGGLFGMLALLALQLARRAHGVRAAFWWISAAALVTLGLDELLEVHERLPDAGMGGGDLLKVVLWLGAAGALACVGKIERPLRSARTAFAIGYAMHTLYLVAEIGDGGVFQLPLPARAIGLLEDLFQLGMLSTYLFAFASMAEVDAERSSPSESVDEFSQAA